LLLAVLLVTKPIVGLAHHSFVAEYDRGKPVKVSGTVTKVEWHARDGSNNASGGTVTFADGRQVFTASPEDARPDGGR